MDFAGPLQKPLVTLPPVLASAGGTLSATGTGTAGKTGATGSALGVRGSSFFDGFDFTFALKDNNPTLHLKQVSIGEMQFGKDYCILVCYSRYRLTHFTVVPPVGYASFKENIFGRWRRLPPHPRMLAPTDTNGGNRLE